MFFVCYYDFAHSTCSHGLSSVCEREREREVQCVCMCVWVREWERKTANDWLKIIPYVQYILRFDSIHSIHSIRFKKSRSYSRHWLLSACQKNVLGVVVCNNIICYLVVLIVRERKLRAHACLPVWHGGSRRIYVISEKEGEKYYNTFYEISTGSLVR